MFGWEICRTAEAMFSRWAVKRLLRFLLKKKLGDYILGDIDLDQLDVQLRLGIVQLSDLALNVDFLNALLGCIPVIVKEGSIASLSVKVPLNMKDWQIEVDELEFVLAPNGFSRGSAAPDNVHVEVDHDATAGSSKKHEESGEEGSSHSAFTNIHEGVKTIAKIVKLFLTSFHVRLKNLIIAFDPGSEVAERNPELCRMLVLRVTEIEFGACISEDMPPFRGPSILGISKLTNFIKFGGAVVEFLDINHTDKKKQSPCLLGRSFNEFYSENSSSSGFTTKILGGPSGGFSGVLDLSIPWKDGCLDINKLSAEVSIGSVHAFLLPSTIIWMVSLRGHLKDISSDCTSPSHPTTDSCFFKHSFHGNTDGADLSLLHQEMVTAMSGSTFLRSHSPPYQERVSESDALHPNPHVIHNWIPLPADFDVSFEAESDYEASMDQFFECFDEMRSSQASLGNSGIWNLAYSVFGAITAASNIASGSEHITSEQKNVEANLKATVAAVHLALVFDDERKHSNHLNEKHQQILDMGETQYKSFTSIDLVDSSIKGEGFESCMSSLPFTDSDQSTKEDLERHDMHFLYILCLNLTLTFQIFPECTKFETVMQHIKIDDHYYEGEYLENNYFHCKNDFPKERNHVQHLQVCVMNALPAFSSVSRDAETDDAPCMSEFHPMKQPGEENMLADILSGPPFNESLKITLFESFGEWSGEYFASSTNLNMKKNASTSISLSIPPFIFWVDICLVNSLEKLFKRIGSSIHTGNSKKAAECDVRLEGTNLTDIDVKHAKLIETISSKNLRGNILLPTARIILCLDLSSQQHSQIYQWDTFLSVDISGETPQKCNNSIRTPTGKSHRGRCTSDYMTICLESGNIDVYLVTLARKNDFGASFRSHGTQVYSATSILSAAHVPNNHYSTFSLILQKGQVTGSQVAQRVWNFAASKDPRTRNKVSGSDDDFSVVTAVPEEFDSQVRQELIESSAFLIHIQFCRVSANISHHEYAKLYHIVNKIMDSLCWDVSSDDVVDSVHNKSISTAGNASQVSMLVKFDFVDICITSDVVEETSKLLQRELPGSWTSLRLKVENFELLSVSNIGDLKDASFFGISHGEGDLWGSVNGMNESPASTHEFLLITCKNSMLRRGGGVGGNATSSGPAGTSILHFKNPEAHYAFTSAVLRCGTIVAPGSRLDWFDTIVTFFRPPCFQEEEGGHCERITSNGDMQYKSSFCLDFVDVALSYEPYIKDIVVSEFNHGSSDMKSSSNRCYVACILAASSFSVCQIAENASNDNYNIRLQDLGLLICQWPGFNKDKRYDIDHLCKTGYAKIASDASVAALVRTNCENDIPWEIEFSDLHVKINSCSDTTTGLVCLLCQLQELFAPDFDDALVHLHSRWSSTHATQESDKLNNVDISEVVSGIEPQIGLRNDAVNDIFFYRENIVQSSPCNLQNELLRKDFVGESRDMDVGCCSYNASPCGISSVGLEQDILLSPCTDRVFLPELLPNTKHHPVHHSDGVPGSQDNSSHGNVNEKSGWYKNDSLVIVENHISVTSGLHLDRQLIDNNNSVNPLHLRTHKPRGRIILKRAEVRWRMLGGTGWSNSPGIDQNACLELQLFGINLQHDMYSDGGLIVSNLSLSITDFFLYDNSLNSPWKMVLGYYHSKKYPRESCGKAFKMNLESVRPNPAIPLEEYRFQLAILPLRLHLDQSQLDFLVAFFSGSSVLESADLNQQLHLEQLSCSDESLPKEALLPFFQKCDIWPIIIRIDYIPRHINLSALRGGKYIELINLLSWKGIDLHLKQVHASGIYGWGGIGEAVVGEWLEDISKNQVHKLLKGLKPINSLFCLSSGAANLVSLPVKDYKKNRGLVKGIQRGAISFIRSISVEAVGLGVHLAGGVHDILLKTECALASSPHLVTASAEEGTSNIRSNQPKDVHQGMQQAYDSLGDGIGRTASALVGKPLKTYQRGSGAGLALVSAIRAAPAAAVAPASSAARAVHCALLGVRNSLDPEHKKDSMEKYRGSSRYED